MKENNAFGIWSFGWGPQRLYLKGGKT